MEILNLARKAAQPNTSGHSAFKAINPKNSNRQFVNAKGVRVAELNLTKGNSACINSNGHHFGTANIDKGSKVVLHHLQNLNLNNAKIRECEKKAGKKVKNGKKRSGSKGVNYKKNRSTIEKMNVKGEAVIGGNFELKEVNIHDTAKVKMVYLI